MVTLHAYGWGRDDILDKSFNNDDFAGSLTYGYLQYRFKKANADIRAGRFFVHEGIVNEQVDGVSLRTDLTWKNTSSPSKYVHVYRSTVEGQLGTLVGGNLRHKCYLEKGTKRRIA